MQKCIYPHLHRLLVFGHSFNIHDNVMYISEGSLEIIGLEKHCSNFSSNLNFNMKFEHSEYKAVYL